MTQRLLGVEMFGVSFAGAAVIAVVFVAGLVALEIPQQILRARRNRLEGKHADEYWRFANDEPTFPAYPPLPEDYKDWK